MSFEIGGGLAPYTVTGGGGHPFRERFLPATPLRVGTPYDFFITDANGCGPVAVSGVNLQCDCVSDAGTMDLNTIDVCEDGQVSVAPTVGELLDGDDALLYILHDNAGNTLGTIYASNDTPDFDLSAIGGLLPNTVYYISAVVGNGLNNGSVDFDDNCLSVSQGTPLLIHELPQASISPGDAICPDDCATLLVTMTGTGPFSVDYEIDHPVDGIQVVTENTDENFFNITICADGLEDSVIGVTLTGIADQFCPGVQLPTIAIVTVGNNNAAGQELYDGCTGDGYDVTINGTLYNEGNPSGTETLTSATGCDSIVTVNLVFNDVLQGEELYDGCTGDGYGVAVNGTIYNEGNPTGTENLTSPAGCDSIVTINLVFNEVLQGAELYTGCEGDGYDVTVNGTLYNETNPTGTENLTSMAGCDSIVTINLVFNDVLQGEELYTGCSGDGYGVTVNGTIYNEANPSGTENLIGSTGCDSIVSINLVFNDVLQGEELYDGCSGDGYDVTVNGTLYNEANPSGTENLTSVAGCDSIVSINLVYNDVLQGEELYDGCSGDGYDVTVNGTLYNEANPSGTENLTSVAGCDSIVSINLVYNDVLQGEELYDGCSGDGYDVTVNGTLYNEANPSGTENLTSVAGCDSIVSINLVYNDVLQGAELYDGCSGDGYDVTVNGTLYNEANPSGTENLTSVAGCDSIVSINLVYNDVLQGAELYDGCSGDGYDVTVNGTLYNEANPSGTENLTSVAGCDSIVSINLVYNDVLQGEELYDGCSGDGYGVTVNGTIYNEGNPAGTENLTSTAGCDSIVAINLVYNDVLQGEELYDGCSGDGYDVTVNGALYNEANPTGTENLTSTAGCDSIVSINLVYNDVLQGEELYTGCMDDGYSIMVNGILYDQNNPSGVETLTSNSGCDSVVVVDLVYHLPNSGEESYEGCIGDGYVVAVNGMLYNEANPTGTEILTNVLGCDSVVVIDLNFGTEVTGEELYNGCTGDGYEVMVDGTVYNQGNPAGTEFLISSAGCDSIVTIDLVYNDFLSGEELYEGCQGDGYSVIVGGILYDESNPSGNETLVSSIGCDSIVGVDLVFHPPVSGMETYTGCEGDGYAVLVNGIVYNQSNPIGMETLTSAVGCDSIVAIDLDFGPALSGEESYEGCQGDGYSVVVNGTVYDQNNPTGSEMLTSIAGCDSIVSIDLIYNDVLPGEELYEGCFDDGYSVVVNGTIYDQNNPAGTEMLTSVAGCDSIVSIDLMFSAVLTGEESYTGCEGDSYEVVVNGVLYNEANPVGSENLVSSSGCDSIVSIDLVYLAATNGSVEHEGCTGDGFSVTVNGTTYDEANPSGMETLLGGNYLGCDSIVMVALSFDDEVVFNLMDTLCGDQSVLIGGVVYDVDNPSGSVTFDGGSVFGCDSTVVVDLSFYDEVTASIQVEPFVCAGDSAALQFTLGGGGTYNVQWSDGGNTYSLSGISDGHVVMVSPLSNTTYTLIDVAALDNPCVPVLQTNEVSIEVGELNVEVAIQTDFDGFSVSCNGLSDGAALATPLNGQMPYVYQWSNGGSAATADNLSAGTYSVTTTDGAGCSATGQVVLTEPPSIEVLLSSQMPTCFGDDDGVLYIDSVWGGGSSYEFSLDGSAFSPLVATPYPIPFLESGDYELTIQDVNGCELVSNTTIAFPNEPTLYVGPDQEIILGDSVTLQTVSDFDIDAFSWSTTDWMRCDTCLTTVVRPLETVVYELVAVDSLGCEARDEVVITVLKPRSVYIPSAFSPNADGTNDVFMMYAGQEVVRVNTFRVFDRWGELVFQQDNFRPDDQQTGWDGFFNGEAMQPGVFVYVAEVVFVDGWVEVYSGDVTLFR